jgi:hypothetical protein
MSNSDINSFSSGACSTATVYSLIQVFFSCDRHDWLKWRAATGRSAHPSIIPTNVDRSRASLIKSSPSRIWRRTSACQTLCDREAALVSDAHLERFTIAALLSFSCLSFLRRVSFAMPGFRQFVGLEP